MVWRSLAICWLVLLGVFLGPTPVSAQEPVGKDQPEVEKRLVTLREDMRAAAKRIDDLQSEVSRLKGRQSSSGSTAAASGLLAFLFGAFCALWAQNTNRSGLLWFLIGVFFNVLAVVVLLIKNANDRERARRERILQRQVADR